jgi:hypothetical protein
MKSIIKNLVFMVVVIVAGAVIIKSFFLPWALASTSVGRVSGQVHRSIDSSFGSLPFVGKVMAGIKETSGVIQELGADIDISTVVSGYNIPRMVNSKSSKIALSFAQSFFGDVKDLDKKSMLVYLMPLFAIVCIMLAITGMRYKISVMAILMISGVISIGGLHALNTMNLSNELVDIVIGKGLWQTMYGYLGIFIISIFWLGTDLIKAKK